MIVLSVFDLGAQRVVVFRAAPLAKTGVRVRHRCGLHDHVGADADSSGIRDRTGVADGVAQVHVWHQPERVLHDRVEIGHHADVSGHSAALGRAGGGVGQQAAHLLGRE